MRIVKYLLIACGLIAAALCLKLNVLQYPLGLSVLLGCLIPAAFGLLGTFLWQGMPRWAAALSIPSFLWAAIKTTPDAFQDIMLFAFFGFVLAIPLTIFRERPRKKG